VPEIASDKEVLKLDANYAWLLAHFDQPELWASEPPLINQPPAKGVRSNSAQHRRFFIVFENGTKAGAGDEAVWREVAYVDSLSQSDVGRVRLLTTCPATMAMYLSPTSVIRHPFKAFPNRRIALASNNASTWDYLLGVLDYARMPFSTRVAFSEVCVADRGGHQRHVLQVDLKNPPLSKGAGSRCVAAIEFVAYTRRGIKTAYQKP